MEFRQLGRSGVQISTLGLGTNNFGTRTEAEPSAKVLHKALDIGVNFVDTANSYGNGSSEEIIGTALVGHRHRVFLTTKVGHPGGPEGGSASRSHIMRQFELSLKRLKTDYVDLYQIHFPDVRTPIEVTLRTLDDLVHQGKVRYIGCSNFAAWQTCEAIWTSRALNLENFVSVQMQYSMLTRDIEKEVVPFCKAYQIGIIPYFPLESGLLTGKYRLGQPPPEGSRFATTPRFKERFQTDKKLALVGMLERFAVERGHTVGELAIAWLLANPIVCSVIAGATTPEQVVANAKGAEWHLSAQEMAEVKKILEREPTV